MAINLVDWQHIRSNWISGYMITIAFSSAININFCTVGDRVLLRQNGSSAQDKPPLLTAPLIQNGKTDTYYGSIEHAVILGKAERELVTTTKDCELRVDHPTLDEYTRFTRRMVTPVSESPTFFQDYAH